MRFLFSFFSPPHRFYVSLPPRRKDEDTQRSNFNRKIVNRKIVNITMILFFRTPSKSVIAVECNHELPQADSDKLCWLFGEATPESEDNLKGHFVGPRREMITPWSTNAVEITQNMGLDGIIRIEEYFPVKDENADHDPMLQRMYKGLDQNVFTTNRQPEPIVHIEDLEAYNEKEGLALSKEEMDYLKKVEKDLGRPLTDSEVFGFAQINSEHCRHKIFGGTFIIDGVEQESSLFQMIKKTTQENPNKIISAYKDNVAFAEGPVIEQFAPADHSKPDYFQVKDIKSVISLKAETHNFPTTVEPFNGASTGTGGEIRDRMGGGKGSWPIAGTAVYMTSYPRTEEGRPWEEILPVRKWLYQTPEQILIKASNGASDFGNKFGQPLICGSVLTFEHKEKDEVYGYDKVIMLAGGVGYGTQRDCLKGTPEASNKVVVIGGDNYRIGLGGGSVSSVDTGRYSSGIELNAVQRANAEMQKRAYNVVRALCEEETNPVVSIHDHGSAGHVNCLSELVEECGGLIDMSKFLPKKLSGGLLRRLNIACGIAHKPKLIFFDEPTVAVDPQSRNKILEGIKKLNRDGATIIYTSHYMEEVEQLCDRILIMDKGKALALGTKDELKRMIKNTETINVEIADLSEAQLDSLKQLHNAYQVSFENGQLRIYFSGGRHNIIHVLDYLEQNNLSFGQVYTQLPTLNDVFLEITGKELRD